MFDIGASELLLIVVVAVVVIGPKDLPLAMRTAGRWIGKIRRVSNHFRAGIDTMIREAEMEEMEKKWQAQNKRIMEQSPAEDVAAAMNSGGMPPEPDEASAGAESRGEPAAPPPKEPALKDPQLPLGDAASKP